MARGQQLRFAKRIGFALLPALLLLAVAECGVRVALRVEPELQSLPLPPESLGLFRDDPLLMWSLKPGLDLEYLGARVVTNRLGLRSPPVEARRESEYRILSLGESTTFGSGVAGDRSYTARAAALLEAEESRLGGSLRFTAINAGVPAYSSFQSLKYLEERGGALGPDLVVFYHEVNDYLPSSLRDSTNNEVGALLTDWELWDSRRASGLAAIVERSALVRFLRLVRARRRVESFDVRDFDNPLLAIGLPDIGLPPRMVRVDGGGAPRPDLNESSLGRRVSEPERRRVFERLVELASERGFELLLIHPSYQASRPHVCLLTRFAAEAGLPLLEAEAELHPKDRPRGSLFRDVWHPSAEGHERLGAALARTIRARLREAGGGSRG